MRRPLFLLVPALLSCSALKLTPAGERVVVGEQRADCRSLGWVQADEGRNFQSAARNVELVRTELRNQAAELGGDTIVLQPAPRADPGCPNCVAMTAAVYRCAGGAAPPAAAPAEKKGSISRVAADAALDAAAASAQTCRTEPGPATKVTVHVTFAPTGDLVFAEVRGVPEGPLTECVARKLRGARVPAFEGPAASLVKDFTLGR